MSLLVKQNENATLILIVFLIGKFEVVSVTLCNAHKAERET